MMTQEVKLPRILIIGAGISGMSLALLLRKHNYTIEIIEKRNYASSKLEEKHSINFTLTHRGFDVLEDLKLRKKIIENSSILTARCIHTGTDDYLLQKYGSKPNQVLYSIRRNKLIEILYDEVTKHPEIDLKLNFSLVDIDKDNWNCKFLDVKNHAIYTTTADLIVGADGAFSTTRSLLLKNNPVTYSQKFFDWKYKKFLLPSNEAIKMHLALDNLHVWSRDETLLVGIPNPNGTLGMLFLCDDHNAGKEANTNLNTKFKKYYGDFVLNAPISSENLITSPVSYLVSIKIDKWVYSNKVILTGDACHAVYPFYGQGMNCALEDSVYLDFILRHSVTLQKALQDFERVRKPNAYALAYLSEVHFKSLQSALASPWIDARNKLDIWLSRYFPKHWKYEYEMVAQTHIPYQKILRIVRRQNRLRKYLGLFVIEFGMVAYYWLKKHLIGKKR